MWPRAVCIGPLREKNGERWKINGKVKQKQWKTNGKQRKREGGDPGGPMGPQPPLFSFVFHWLSIVFVSLFHWFSNVSQFFLEVVQKKRSGESLISYFKAFLIRATRRILCCVLTDVYFPTSSSGFQGCFDSRDAFAQDLTRPGPLARRMLGGKKEGVLWVIWIIRTNEFEGSGF